MASTSLTPRAEAQLYEIWSNIALDSPRAADAWFQRVMRKIHLAADLPHMGAPRPELSATARILVEGRYIVIYEPQADGVKVVAIVHGARDPASWLR